MDYRYSHCLPPQDQDLRVFEIYKKRIFNSEEFPIEKIEEMQADINSKIKKWRKILTYREALKGLSNFFNEFKS